VDPALLLGRWGRGMAGLAVTPRALVQGFEMGAKSALGIGAACACVGFVLGITTLTGMGFKFSAFVIDLSARGGAVVAVDVIQWFDRSGVTILFGLLFTAIACIIMGSGVPDHAHLHHPGLIVAPALAQLGVPQLATHFFVFYFGVLADVTPPVALAAFAAAGIARSEPDAHRHDGVPPVDGQGAGAVCLRLRAGAAVRRLQSLIFGHPLVLLVAGSAVLAILAWHVRPERAPVVA
jgi:TRAP-type uncharacterized transport system fused permease subunit